MLDKLAAVETRYNELAALMATPEVTSQPELLIKYGQEHANLGPVVETYRRYRRVLAQRHDTHQMLADDLDDEMKAMVREEIDNLDSEQATLEQKLQLMLLPKDPNDDKNYSGCIPIMPTTTTGKPKF
jgi:peptide chain release factor 1